VSEIKNVGQTWMALNTFKCNCLIPLYFKGLKTSGEIEMVCRNRMVERDVEEYSRMMWWLTGLLDRRFGQNY